jgi:hypothetical protein
MALSGQTLPELGDLATSSDQGLGDGAISTGMPPFLPFSESAEDSGRYLLPVSPSSNHGESIAAGIHPPEEIIREHADDPTLASGQTVGLLKKRYVSSNNISFDKENSSGIQTSNGRK